MTDDLRTAVIEGAVTTDEPAPPAPPRVPDAADLEVVTLDRLHHHPNNPRVHDDAAIEASMRDHGIVDIVVAQRSTGAILGGNGRYDAATVTGAAAVPVLWVDCDDDEAEQILLVLNAASDKATYDWGKLNSVIDSVKARGDVEALRRSGWTEDALARVRKTLAAANKAEAPADPETDFDAGAELRTQYGTEPGQLWSIKGALEHRLLVADASDPECVARLLGGESIDLIVTSPPYNVGVDYGRRGELIDHVMDRKSIDPDTTWDDQRTWAEYRDFLLSIMRVWVEPLAPGRYVAWNVGVSPKTFPHRQSVMFEDDLGLRYARQLTWLKVGCALPTWQYTTGNPLVRSFHPNWMHELIYLFTKGEPAKGEMLDRLDETFKDDTPRIAQAQATIDVPDTGVASGATMPGLKARKAHPAVFPVAVPAGVITHLADPGAIVFDPFMGAGTTILAAEQRGRRGYGTELSPEYAAVALHRATALGMVCELLY